MNMRNRLAIRGAVVAAAALLAAPAGAQAPPAAAPPPAAPPPPNSAAPPALLQATPPTDPNGCGPMALFRTVVRNVTPGLMASDRAAQPRTFYRFGSKFFRSEESPFPGNGDQNIIIVSEPDMWVLNVPTRRARHSRDLSALQEVRAPILPAALDTPPAFRTLEFGCEGAFVDKYAPRAQGLVNFGAGIAAVHQVSIGDQTVVLLMDQRRNLPLVLSYVRQGRPVLVLRYDEYRLGLGERLGLFAPPARGYQITESKGETPTLQLN